MSKYLLPDVEISARRDTMHQIIISLLNTRSSKEIPYLKLITRYYLTFLAACFSNVISLVLRDSDADSENVSLIRRSVSDGQKTCSSNGVSLIGINDMSVLDITRINYTYSRPSGARTLMARLLRLFRTRS